MLIAIGLGAGIMVAAGLLYLHVVSNGAQAKVDGAAIVFAAHALTTDLRARNQPVPNSIHLRQLVALHYLKPEQIAAFEGLDATLFLTGDQSNPTTVLMRVRMTDGTDLVLFSNGSTQQETPPH